MAAPSSSASSMGWLRRLWSNDGVTVACNPSFLNPTACPSLFYCDLQSGDRLPFVGHRGLCRPLWPVWVVIILGVMITMGGLFLLLRSRWRKLHNLIDDEDNKAQSIASTVTTNTSSSSPSSPSSSSSPPSVSQSSLASPTSSSSTPANTSSTSPPSQSSTALLSPSSTVPVLRTPPSSAPSPTPTPTIPTTPSVASASSSPSVASPSLTSLTNSGNNVPPIGMVSPRVGGTGLPFAMSNGPRSPEEAKAAYAEREKILAASHIQLLTSGTLRCRKWGRDRKRKDVIIQCTSDLTTLQWGANRLSVDTIRDVLIGRSSPVFIAVDSRRTVLEREPDEVQRSFSVVFKSRTLDLELPPSIPSSIAISDRSRAVAAFKWLMSRSVGSPFSVQHRTHVDAELKWSGQDLEKTVRLTTKLGEGAFGVVYCASVQGFQMAIKMVHAKNDDALTEVKREMTMLQQCRNKHIVGYYGCWGPDSRKRLWLLMDYCGAGSVVGITDLLGEQNETSSSELRLTEEQVAYVLACTLMALDYLHSRKIVHRDVKGRNILLTNQGECKLADFGVSKSLAREGGNDDSGTAGLAGSPHWMPPEVISGRESDYKADIWALGITAIEIAEKRVPHEEMTSTFRVLRAITSNAPPTLRQSNWSAKFRGFLSLCLTKDPKERPDATTMLSHPFIATAGHKGDVLLSAIAQANERRTRARAALRPMAIAAIAAAKDAANGRPPARPPRPITGTMRATTATSTSSSSSNSRSDMTAATNKSTHPLLHGSHDEPDFDPDGEDNIIDDDDDTTNSTSNNNDNDNDGDDDGDDNDRSSTLVSSTPLSPLSPTSILASPVSTTSGTVTNGVTTSNHTASTSASSPTTTPATATTSSSPSSASTAPTTKRSSSSCCTRVYAWYEGRVSSSLPLLRCHSAITTRWRRLHDRLPSRVAAAITPVTLSITIASMATIGIAVMVAFIRR